MNDNHNYMRQLENLLNQIQHQNMPIETIPVKVLRRALVPSLQQITSSTIRNTYPGMYNIVTGRPYVGGFRSIYSPERLYDQSMPSLLNPFVIVETEHYGPTFDSIEVIVNAFNSLNVLVLSIYNTIQISFSLVLDCSDIILQLRLLIIKLRSSAKLIKVVQWFLTNVIYLLNIIKRSSGSNTEDISNENCGSSNNENSCIVPIATQDEEIYSVEGSWHLFVFTELLDVTPHIIHKIMGTPTLIIDFGSINGGNGYYNRDVPLSRRSLNILRPRHSRYFTMDRNPKMNSMIVYEEILIVCEDGWLTI